MVSAFRLAIDYSGFQLDEVRLRNPVSETGFLSTLLREQRQHPTFARHFW
jgi:hypothetical protein